MRRLRDCDCGKEIVKVQRRFPPPMTCRIEVATLISASTSIIWPFFFYSNSFLHLNILAVQRKADLHQPPCGPCLSRTGLASIFISDVSIHIERALFRRQCYANKYVCFESTSKISPGKGLSSNAATGIITPHRTVNLQLSSSKYAKKD